MTRQIVRLEDLTPDPHNANRGTQRGRGMIEASLRELGGGRSIVVDRNGVVIAGNKTLEAAVSVGLEARVVHTNGQELTVVVRDDLDLLSPDGGAAARRLAYLDNRTTEVGLDWDPEILAEDLSAGFDFDGIFSPEELQGAIGVGMAEDAQEERRAIDGMPPARRDIALDAVCCISPPHPLLTRLAVDAGLRWGSRSSNLTPFVQDPARLISQFGAPVFIDNHFQQYKHAEHLEVVAAFCPKYATVRDIMSRKQCEEAGIDYYDFDEIMRHAEEVEPYVERVIVIPKIDCIHEIPEKYNLGYSVPTSFGATPLPAEMFRGRRIHLLGGSWKAQRSYLAYLGDDVVSLDMNHAMRIAQYGRWVDNEGEDHDLSSIIGQSVGRANITNPFAVCFALSVGHIAQEVWYITRDDSYAETLALNVDLEEWR